MKQVSISITQESDSVKIKVMASPKGEIETRAVHDLPSLEGNTALMVELKEGEWLAIE